ncbi:MAG: DUF6077 domain-containing protein [Lachnospiraceae bacterium]|nr:DUF6077 domain-containing protein [Lachnospiraceae bacterium]
MMVFSILGLILWLVIVPFAIGFLPVKFIERKRITCGNIFAAGYLVMLAVFQLIAVPFVLAGRNMYELTICTVVVLTLLAISGIWCSRKNKIGMSLRENYRETGKCLSAWRSDKKELETMIYWVIALGLIAFQMYHAIAYASFDGDDAYYVVQSVSAAESGDLYRTLPYTGFATALDTRHALALFPLWIAFLAQTSGLHATIMAHTLLPLVLIPLTYLYFYLIGRKLLEKESDHASETPHKLLDNLPVFMILISLLQIFGNVSLYTNATFFLTRTWQGKSVLANLVMISVSWLLLCVAKDGKVDKSVMILLFCTNMTAALATTMGVFLTAVLIAGVGFFLSIYHRSFQLLWRLGLCCIPCVVYALLYVML